MDQDHLLRLLLIHRAMITGYVAFLVRDPHLVEDVFQEVALTVLKKGGELDRPENFPRWVRTIARLKSLKALEQKQRSPRPLSDALLDRLEESWAAADHQARSPRSEALTECLEQLTPRSRRLIELRFGESLRGQELAGRLSQPVNTIYVSLSRIYRTLAECIRGRLAREGWDHA